MVILGLLSTNIAGSTKRSVASGWVFVCYCVGQIAGPQFFKSTEAPAYHNGIVAMLCGFILNLVMNQILRFIYVRENKKRDQMLEGKSEEEIAEMQREGEALGFEDVTDKQNVSATHKLWRAGILTSWPAHVPVCSVIMVIESCSVTRHCMKSNVRASNVNVDRMPFHVRVGLKPRPCYNKYICANEF